MRRRAQRESQILHGLHKLVALVLRALDMGVDDGHDVLVRDERRDGTLQRDDAARHAGDGRRQRHLARPREHEDVVQERSDVDIGHIARAVIVQ